MHDAWRPCVRCFQISIQTFAPKTVSCPTHRTMPSIPQASTPEANVERVVYFHNYAVIHAYFATCFSIDAFIRK
jgi:hypothetical protein